MRQNGSVFLLALMLSFILAAPSVLRAEGSYIDELARQVQQDIESGAIKDKVTPVDTSSQPSTPASPQTPVAPRSAEDRELDQLHLARFFGTLLGPDEFATDEFWEGPDLEETGSYSFGDSVQNPTVLDLFGSGSGRVIGSDTDFNRPWNVNDATLRDAINSGDISTIGQRLGELGYMSQNFRIEYQ